MLASKMRRISREAQSKIDQSTNTSNRGIDILTLNPFNAFTPTASHTILKAEMDVKKYSPHESAVSGSQPAGATGVLLCIYVTI